ncbi:MAG TPA: hypothetical protein VFW19_01230 [Allosphingosinicella sp.]|nr:hypothetical protein [Allosphingosinicella sp.]
MAVLLGGIAGACVLVLILSWLLEWIVIARIVEEADKAIILSVVAGTVGAILIAVTGSLSGPLGWLVYVVGGCIVLPLRLRAHHKRVERAGAAEDLQQTFE